MGSTQADQPCELLDSHRLPADATSGPLPPVTAAVPSKEELRKIVKRALRESQYVDPELRRSFARMASQVLDGVRPFRFLDLPSEIRTRISESLMLTREPRMIPSICARETLESTRPHEICLVNRQIRQEALAVFYGGNTFKAHIHRNDFSFFTSWLDLIGDANRRRLRTVHLVLLDRWLCADGLLDLVRALSRISGTEKLAFTIDTTEWVQKYSCDDDSETSGIASDAPEKSIKKTFKILERALNLVQRLRESGKVSETKLRFEFQKWLNDKSYKCKGHPLANLVHHKGFGYGGYCSIAGRESSPSMFIPCERGLSSLSVDIKRETWQKDVSSNDVDEGL